MPEMKAVLDEVKHEIPSRPNRLPRFIQTTRLVRVGESFEDKTSNGALVSFEVFRINLATESIQFVKAARRSCNASTRLPTPPARSMEL